MRKTRNNFLLPSNLEIALIKTFVNTKNDKHVALTMPLLRAEMERDVSRVSSKGITKDEFLGKCIPEMKSVILNHFTNKFLIMCLESINFVFCYLF